MHGCSCLVANAAQSAVVLSETVASNCCFSSCCLLDCSFPTQPIAARQGEHPHRSELWRGPRDPHQARPARSGRYCCCMLLLRPRRLLVPRSSHDKSGLNKPGRRRCRRVVVAAEMSLWTPGRSRAALPYSLVLSREWGNGSV